MNKNCSGCKKLILGTVMAAITMFVFEWVFHGKIMELAYLATGYLWRPDSEMGALFPLCIARLVAEAFLLTWIFSRNYEAKGAKEGVRFGLAMGGLIGLVHFASYVYLPIPLSMALSWFAGDIVMGVLVGLALTAAFESKLCAPKVVEAPKVPAA